MPDRDIGSLEEKMQEELYEYLQKVEKDSIDKFGVTRKRIKGYIYPSK